MQWVQKVLKVFKSATLDCVADLNLKRTNCNFSTSIAILESMEKQFYGLMRQKINSLVRTSRTLSVEQQGSRDIDTSQKRKDEYSQIQRTPWRKSAPEDIQHETGMTVNLSVRQWPEAYSHNNTGVVSGHLIRMSLSDPVIEHLDLNPKEHLVM